MSSGPLDPFDRDEVLAGVDALTRLAPTEREAFLLRNLERAEAMAAELYPGEDAESYIRRELFVGMAVATGPVDADMLWGDGSAPFGENLRGLVDGPDGIDWL